MNYMKIIDKYFSGQEDAKEIYLKHVKAVKNKALEIAKRIPELHPDLTFIEEASMLHDIGMVQTKAESMKCFGTQPYIKHGIIGREILEAQGEEWKKHALVCERHTGVGLSREEIIRQNLPLPHRDMIPISIEEEIICFADLFFSKNPLFLEQELSIECIRGRIAEHNKEDLKKFEEWLIKFKEVEN